MMDDDWAVGSVSFAEAFAGGPFDCEANYGALPMRRVVLSSRERPLPRCSRSLATLQAQNVT